MLYRARCYHGNMAPTAVLLMSALLLAAPCSGADDGAAGASPWPTHFSAAYHLYNRGMKVAEMVRTMESAADGEFLFRSDTRTTGLFALVRKDRIVEESRWRFADGEPQSLSYSYTRTGHKARKVAVQFNQDTRRITNTINGESWLMPAEPEVVDKLLYQFALMSDLRTGDTSLDYTVADGGKVKVYEIEPLGEESVRTPLGDVPALKFRHQKVGDDRLTTIWCAPRYQYLPVQVEYEDKDGNRVRAVLQSVTGL